MDPPVLSFAGRQLLHDLDLVVLPSASGEGHMGSSSGNSAVVAARATSGCIWILRQSYRKGDRCPPKVRSLCIPGLGSTRVWCRSAFIYGRQYTETLVYRVSEYHTRLPRLFTTAILAPLSLPPPKPYSLDFALGRKGSSPIFSNGLTSCCDMVNNVERVVVPVETASAVTTETKEYTIRIMAYQLIEADQQVGTSGKILTSGIELFCKNSEQTLLGAISTCPFRLEDPTIVTSGDTGASRASREASRASVTDTSTVVHEFCQK